MHAPPSPSLQDAAEKFKSTMAPGRLCDLPLKTVLSTVQNAVELCWDEGGGSTSWGGGALETPRLGRVVPPLPPAPPSPASAPAGPVLPHARPHSCPIFSL